MAVIIHASYLVLIQKSSLDSEHGPLTAQYAIATMASPVRIAADGRRRCRRKPFNLLTLFLQVLLVCSFISMDTITMWSYEGWKDPRITAIFVCCILIGCAMNFTTLHCTYINSAVTTSFVGVVKSIATITVGMLAFNDVAPTGLFIGGVVVNTVGSITYCVVKYHEMKKKSSYEDLEEAGKDGAPPGEPYGDAPPPPEDGPSSPDVLALANGDVWTADPGANAQIMTEQEVLEMQREHLQKENSASAPSVSESYLGVWRSIRHLQFLKKEPLVHNMEQQSP